MSKNVVENKQQTYIKTKNSKKKKVVSGDSDDSQITEDYADDESGDDDSNGMKDDSSSANIQPTARVVSNRAVAKPIISSNSRDNMEGSFDDSDDDSKDSDFENDESESDNERILLKDEIAHREDMSGVEEVDLLRAMQLLSPSQLQQYYDDSDDDPDDADNDMLYAVGKIP
jgi:hypothetical protein